MFLVSPQAERLLRYIAGYVNAIAPTFARRLVLTIILLAVTALGMWSGRVGSGDWLANLIFILALAIVAALALSAELLKIKRVPFITDSRIKTLYYDWGRAIKALPKSERPQAQWNRFTAVRRLDWQEADDETLEAEIAKYRTQF